MFADEPTGALDTISSAEVMGMLRRFVKEMGQTVIMVTHDAAAASYADRALVFADGRIVADVANPTEEGMTELVMRQRQQATAALGNTAVAD